MGQNTYDGASGVIIESLPRVVAARASLLAQDFSPFLSILMGRGVEMINSTQYEWHDYSLRDVVLTVGGDGVSTSGDTTVVVTTSSASDSVRVGDQLIPEDSQERLLVTGVNSDTLTVTRGYGGTVKATIASGDTLTVISSSALEGADFVNDGTHAPVVRTNFTQVFHKGFKIAGSQSAPTLVSSLDGAGNKQLRIEEHTTLREQVRMLAGAVINGVAPASTTQGSATVRRTMNGIVEQVREGALAGTGGLYSDISGADFNGADAYDNLVALLKTGWDAGGTPQTALMGSRIKRQLDLNVPDVERPGNANFVNHHIQQFDTSFGRISYMLEPNMPDDLIAIVDINKISLKAMADRQFFFKQLGSDGDSERHMLIGEYTLQVEDAATGGHIIGHSAAA